MKKILVSLMALMVLSGPAFAKNGYIGNGEKLRVYFEKECKICADMSDEKKANLVFRALKDVQDEYGLNDIALGEGIQPKRGDIDITDALIRKLRKINSYF